MNIVGLNGDAFNDFNLYFNGHNVVLSGPGFPELVDKLMVFLLIFHMYAIK